MEEIDIDDLQRRMEGAIASLTKDFQGLRTGRANSQLLDGIMVDVYGATMPINQVLQSVCRSLECYLYKFGIKIMLNWLKNQ